jgi:DNA-binding XRE family transcriptional regulator
MNTDKDFLILLGKSIVSRRKSMGLSQVALANLIGMDKQNLLVIEKGKSNPQLITLLKICSGLKITFAELFDYEFDYETFLTTNPTHNPRKHIK